MLEPIERRTDALVIPKRGSSRHQGHRKATVSVLLSTSEVFPKYIESGFEFIEPSAVPGLFDCITRKLLEINAGELPPCALRQLNEIVQVLLETSTGEERAFGSGHWNAIRSGELCFPSRKIDGQAQLASNPSEPGCAVT